MNDQNWNDYSGPTSIDAPLWHAANDQFFRAGDPAMLYDQLIAGVSLSNLD